MELRRKAENYDIVSAGIVVMMLVHYWLVVALRELRVACYNHPSSIGTCRAVWLLVFLPAGFQGSTVL